MIIELVVLGKGKHSRLELVFQANFSGGDCVIDSIVCSAPPLVP